MTTDTPTRGTCPGCGRENIAYTSKGLRAHTANGGRRTDGNPYCGQGTPLAAVSGPFSPPPVPVDPPAATAPQTAAHGLLMGSRSSEGGQYIHELVADVSANAFLMAEPPPSDGSAELIKGGRYDLPDPITGAPRRWTRATTMAETLSDLYAINLWKLRMATIGFVRHPGLLDDLREIDGDDKILSPKDHKDELNKVHWRAQNLAGDKVPANWGTQMHLNIERLSRDEITVDQVPDMYRSEVTAWAAAMADADLSAVPHLIERRVAVPLFNTAGTLDQIDRVHRSRSIRLGSRVVRLNAGDHVIGDVKSGRSLDYGWGEIAIQIAIYAHGAREGKVAKWDPESKAGPNGAWVWEDIGIDPKSVRPDVGVVMHVPIGQKHCTLHWIDLSEGWKALQLCEAVRDWRRTKGLNTPFTVAEVPTEAPAPVVRPATWEERFAAVTSKRAAFDLYEDYVGKNGPGPEADRLAKIAMNHLASLHESSA